MREPGVQRDGKKGEPRVLPVLVSRRRSWRISGTRRSPFCRLPNAPPSSSVSAITGFINKVATGVERPKESTSQGSLLQTSLVMACSLWKEISRMVPHF